MANELLFLSSIYLSIYISIYLCRRVSWAGDDFRKICTSTFVQNSLRAPSAFLFCVYCTKYTYVERIHCHEFCRSPFIGYKSLSRFLSQCLCFNAWRKKWSQICSNVRFRLKFVCMSYVISWLSQPLLSNFVQEIFWPTIN